MEDEDEADRRYDAPQGRRAEVERLLQVLAVLRHGDGRWVPRTRLREGVTEYRLATSETALEKLVARDLNTLRLKGFDLESETGTGAGARDRLGTSSWRVPVDLSPAERTLLAWAVAVTSEGSVVPDDGGPDDGLPSRRSAGVVAGLVRTPPPSIGLVQAALAGRRALVISDDGVEKTTLPVQLVQRGVKWFLLLRYPGRDTVYGYRLESLRPVRLGDPVPVPQPAPDLDAVLSPLRWDKDPVTEVEITCATAHLARVLRDFEGFAVTADDGATAVLVGTTTHVSALVDRVLGQAGRVVVRRPQGVVDRVVETARALAVPA